MKMESFFETKYPFRPDEAAVVKKHSTIFNRLVGEVLTRVKQAYPEGVEPVFRVEYGTIVQDTKQETAKDKFNIRGEVIKMTNPHIVGGQHDGMDVARDKALFANAVVKVIASSYAR